MANKGSHTHLKQWAVVTTSPVVTNFKCHFISSPQWGLDNLTIKFHNFLFTCMANRQDPQMFNNDDALYNSFLIEDFVDGLFIGDL